MKNKSFGFFALTGLIGFATGCWLTYTFAIKEIRSQFYTDTEIRSIQIRRYEWLADALKDKGFLPWLRFDDDLQPNECLIEFLGLTEQQSLEFVRVCNENLNAIQEWEKEKASFLKQSEGISSYEIPQLPEAYKKNFIDSLEAVIGKDDRKLLAGVIEQMFNDITCKRIVTFSITPSDYGGLQYKLHVQRFAIDGHESGSSTRSGSYEAKVSRRWNHLFTIK